ncbi:hypothetical protein J3E72DRAFT_268456 [Bipolaris maydis]|nr:hypothetical protein J3E72DRAFT_268456 [Bipolaris maydis]
MRASIAIIATLTSQIVHAQSGMDMFPGSMAFGSMVTCQNGYVPSLTCENPVPETCACTCSDGMTFNQPRPPVVDPVPPPVEPPHQLVDKPCTTEIIQPWREIQLPHVKNSYEPSQMFEHEVEVAEGSVFVVADSAGRCQHFEVFVDGVSIGETDGPGELDNFRCGTPEECMEKHGGSKGYFTLPGDLQAMLIGITWSVGTYIARMPRFLSSQVTGAHWLFRQRYKRCLYSISANSVS